MSFLEYLYSSLEKVKRSKGKTRSDYQSFKGASKRRKRVNSNSNTLGYEALEDRRVLTTFYLDPQGIFWIGGTLGNDTMRAEIVQSNVLVTINSTSQTRPISQVHQLVFIGRAGDDTITNDTSIPSQMWGGPGNDTLTGGAGNDLLVGNGGNDTMFGRGGNDTFYGSSGVNFIEGGDGNDVIFGGKRGKNTIYGGNGDDRIYGGNFGQGDEIWGGAGNDIIHGGWSSADSDIMPGSWGDGKNTIHGESGNDRIRAGNKGDEIWGGDGNDWIRGGPENDIIHGGSSDDEIYGGDGDDEIWGDAGDDWIAGNNGNDIIYGGPGNNRLYGQVGNDSLYAEGGGSKLYGGAGNDGLFGGAGNESLLDPGTGKNRVLVTGGVAWSAVSATGVPLSANDVIINFVNQTSNWTYKEIEALDRGLRALHHRTNGTKILRDTTSNTPLTIAKYVSLGGANARNSLQYSSVYQNGSWNLTFTREIGVSDFDENNEHDYRFAGVVLVHEISHNWDSVYEINRVIPMGHVWTNFLTTGGWTNQNPNSASWVQAPVTTSDPAEFNISSSNNVVVPVYTWWHHNSSVFAHPNGKQNAKEDWGATWELVLFKDIYDGSEPTSHDYTASPAKAAVVIDFFNNIS